MHSGVVWGVFEGIRRCLGCVLCQKRLKLSCEVEECKPLVPGPPAPPPPEVSVPGMPQDLIDSLYGVERGKEQPAWAYTRQRFGST